MIRDERDYERHVDYIHYNPVKHGYAKHAADWPHSSIHRHSAAGMMNSEWGGDNDVNEDGGHGE